MRVRGTSREKLYQELGFESLQQRRWYRKLCCLFKIINNQSPSYLFQLVPSPNIRYFAKLIKNSPTSYKIRLFQKLLFCLDYQRVEQSGSASKSISIFKSNILKFIRPKPNNIYYCHNPKGIRLLTRLRLGLGHLRKHKFKHSFQDFLNPLCFFGDEIETPTHYLLHRPTYTNERMTLLNKIKVSIVTF